MTEPPMEDRLAEFIGDPRESGGFEPKLFPLCNGSPFADGVLDTPLKRNHMRFLSIYYRLNKAYARLDGLAADESVSRSETLQHIRKLTLARDRLEDVFAPYGFIGEPELQNGIAHNIVFAEPPQRFVESKAGGLSSFCLTFSLPDPRSPGDSVAE